MQAGLYNEKDELMYNWQSLLDLKYIFTNNNNTIVYYIKSIEHGTHLVLDDKITQLESTNNIIEKIYIPPSCSFLSETIDFETNIKYINVDPLHEMYSSEDGVLFNKEKTKIIRYPKKDDIVYTVPKSVEIIDNDCFCGALKLEEIKLHNNIKKIGTGAFATTNIKKITIPNSLQILNRCVFYNCKNLKEINMPKTIKEISEFALQRCNNVIINYEGTEDDFFKIKNYNGIFDGNSLNLHNIKFCHKKTLEDLINEGKSLREANYELKQQEKER